jgi:hypothetical protein
MMSQWIALGVFVLIMAGVLAFMFRPAKSVKPDDRREGGIGTQIDVPPSHGSSGSD